MSTLSTPMPARPITFKLVAASMISLVTVVAERSARPSYWAITALSSSGRMTGFMTTAAAGAWPAGRGSGHLERNPGPVEPGTERLNVSSVDGRAAPDAKARRGIAIAGDVVSRAFLLKQAGESLDEVGVGAFDGEAHRSARADALVLGQVSQPIALGDDLVERRGIGVG